MKISTPPRPRSIESGVAGERRPGPVPPSHLPLATFFDSNDVEQIRTGRAEAHGDERLAAAMKAVGTKAPIAVRLAARLIDEGAAASLDEGLRMELAHLRRNLPIGGRARRPDERRKIAAGVRRAVTGAGLDWELGA